jgi:Zn-dependent peptidase ImmA (M78 family)
MFLERQGDDIIVSWDASPTPTRFYQIQEGEEIFNVAVAVPVLRKLVTDRLKSGKVNNSEHEAISAVQSSDAAAGYAALKRYSPLIDESWLASHGFSDMDAKELALSGTSHHPIVGLLRSSQGSSLTPADHDAILKLLKRGKADSHARLREIAKGLNPGIDAREPWESGYQLARLIRERLGFSQMDYIDIESVVRQKGIEIYEVEFGDPVVLGVCVGTSGYLPLVVLNTSCQDVTGVSGRRITLAHEFCHLMFDRARMRALARVEGGGADSDRLIEMRANAFAVELLVPMSSLVGDDGDVVDDDRLTQIAVDREVSLHALQWHAKNLRTRLLGRN